jgi:DNA-directed RNA polymerase specialized sigma24 family protein
VWQGTTEIDDAAQTATKDSESAPMKNNRKSNRMSSVNLEAGSITQLIALVKAEDDRAAMRLWERYFQRLTGVARRVLARTPRALADEEDAVLSAFASLLRGVDENRFKRLEDRDDLWQILVMLTVRKSINQRNHAAVKKRGAGKARGESAFATGSDEREVAVGIANVVADDPTPEFIVAMDEQCQLLMNLLDDDQRQLAQWRLEGYTNEDIAQMTGHILTWVERKFRIIRRRWLSAIE